MSVVLVDCEKYVMDILNAARETYGTINFPLFKAGGITEAVKAAALSVMATIYDTPGHRYRDLALELRAVMNGELLKGAIGAVLIDSEKGTAVKPSKLTRLKANRGSLTTITGGRYYCVEGHIVNFIGADAVAETLKALSGSDFDCPSEYEGAVISGGAFFAFPKEGTNTPAATMFREAHFEYLKMIREGKTDMPAFNPFGQVS